MKAISILLLASLAALACGYAVPHKTVKYAEQDFLVKQQKLLEVFQHVHQVEVHSDLWKVSKEFKFADHFEDFTNVEAVKSFYYMYEHGLLPFDEVFSVHSQKHLDQAVALFKVFYYAKNWDVFYKSMVWARFHVNEGMFIYALTVAMTHRSDFAGLELPAIYEIFPYYFFNSEVIQKAQQYKMQGFYGVKKVNDIYEVIIPSNYTGWYVHTNAEQKVSYFTEDIGLNSFYYYFHVDYPFWMGGEEFGLYKDRRGENFFFQHQQLLARYYLERLSNDLGVVPDFSWYNPIETGYYPNLRYYNGLHFPSRDNHHFVYTEDNYYNIYAVEDWERRISDVIEMGYFHLPDGSFVNFTNANAVELLGNIVEGNKDSVNQRYFGKGDLMAHILIGGSVEHFEDHKVIPSVMEHYETSLRDPMTWVWYKRVLHLYWQFKNHLPHYTAEEVSFPGVKIESVEVDKLITYFDFFYADITNAVDVEIYDEKVHTEKQYGRIAHYNGEDFVIKSKSSRLNHVPFGFKLNVVSDKAVKSVVRVYIGPKYDHYGTVYGVNENRENFFLLDVFPYQLEVGKNVISRQSTEYGYFVKDRTQYFELYKWVMQAEKGEKQFPMDMTEAHCGFPHRLMLPKGKKGGMPFQFYFIVSPYHAPKYEQFSTYEGDYSCGVGSGSRYVDALPFGYPFDRQIVEQYWFYPNMYYYDVNIFHKSEIDVNAV